VKREQLRTVPPEYYGGPLDAEQAGIVLALAARNQLRLTDADRQRATALSQIALDAEGRALADLHATLRAWNRQDDTLWLVTSDVGFDAGANVPFIEAEGVDESRMYLPLIAVGPGARIREEAPSDVTDIAPTILSAFGLGVPEDMKGHNLRGGNEGGVRARIATSGRRISLRLGDYVLVKNGDHDARLCSLDLEPACLADVRSTHPVGHALLRRELLATQRTLKPQRKDRAVLDPMTATMLEAWGTSPSAR
jgi:arylsulfatase A-like enzyme